MITNKILEDNSGAVDKPSPTSVAAEIAVLKSVSQWNSNEDSSEESDNPKDIF